MDPELYTLLSEEWQVPKEFCIKLQGKGILTYSQLKRMKETDVNEIFDRLVHRLHFKDCFKECFPNAFKEQNDSTEINSVRASGNGESSSSFGSQQTSPSGEVSSGRASGSGVLSSLFDSQQISPSGEAGSSKSSAVVSNVGNEDNLVTTLRKLSGGLTLPNSSNVSKDKNNERDLGSSTPVKRRRCASPVKESDLKTLCRSCLNGKIVLNYYKENNELDDTHRSLLGDVILNDFLKDDEERRLPHETELKLTKSILELFPTETQDIWVASSSHMRDKSVGRGILITKYYAFRKKAKQGGLLKKPDARPSTSGNQLMAYRLSLATGDDDEFDATLYEEKDLWLCNNKHPWSEVLKVWKETSKLRMRNLLGGSITVNDYLKKYPALRDPTGYLLLETDFDIFHEGRGMSLFAEWTALSAFIEANALKPIRLQINNSTSSEGKKSRTIQALTCLFNVVTKGREDSKQQDDGEPQSSKTKTSRQAKKGGKEKQWRPSRQESAETLLLHVKTVGDIIPTLAARVKKYEPYGFKLAPQAIVVGPSLDSIEKCFVRVNDTLWEVETPLKAVDIAFKVMHSLDCQYPKESEREWYFLETSIYAINLDKKNPLRTKIAAAMKNFESFKSCQP